MESKPLLENDNPKSELKDTSLNVDKSWKGWKKDQVIPCIMLCFTGFLGLMCDKSIGPSLLDLQIRTGASVDQISWVLSVRAIGGMLGAIVMGETLHHHSRWLQVSTTQCLMAMIFALAPWITNYWAMLAVFFFYGITANYSLSGGMLTSFAMWEERKDSVSWQNLHQFAFSFGGLFGPLMVRPFLTEIADDSEIDANSTHINSTATPTETLVMYGYLIGGVTYLLGGISLYITYCAFGGIYDFEHRKIRAEDQEGTAMERQKPTSSKTPKELVKMRIVFIAILAVYYVFQSVVLRTYNNFILAFTVNGLGWSKSMGATLTSAYHATSMVSKFTMIFIGRYFNLDFLLFLGICLTNVACLLNLFVEYHDSVVWVGSLLMAWATPIPIAILLGWIDNYVGLRGQVSVTFSAAGSLGEVIAAPLIGYLFENVSYISIMYLNFGCTLGCLLTMVCLQMLGRSYKRRNEELNRYHTL